MPPVTVTYSLTADQFMAACNALWSHQAIGKNGNLIAAGILAVASGICLGYAPGAAFFLVPAMVFFATSNFVRNRIWRRHYATLAKYSGPIIATFGPDTINFQSAEGMFSQNWSVFGAFTETSDHIFLHVGGNTTRGQFSVIPKFALAGQGDLAALLALISTKLPKCGKRWL